MKMLVTRRNNMTSASERRKKRIGVADNNEERSVGLTCSQVLSFLGSP